MEATTAPPRTRGRGTNHLAVSSRRRRGRLSRSSDFERVYRQGRSRSNRWLVLHAFPRPGADQPRLGVSVSRRVGGAVDRNRVKRLLREAFWGEPGVGAQEHDFVVVARPEARELAEREGLAGMRRALGELLEEGDREAATEAAGGPAG